MQTGSRENEALTDDLLSKRISFRLLRVSTMLTVQASSILKKSGNLTLNQWRLLSFLHERGNSSVSDIVKTGTVDKSTMSRAASEMVKRGMIVPEQSASDQRRTTLRLTAEGRAAYAKAAPAMLQRQADLVNALTEQENQQLTRILGKLENAVAGSEGKQT